MAVKKIYYSMGEVAEMFDVRPSLIRHWESQFACLKPHKNQKGNRMFTEADVEKLKHSNIHLLNNHVEFSELSLYMNLHSYMYIFLLPFLDM